MDTGIHVHIIGMAFDLRTYLSAYLHQALVTDVSKSTASTTRGLFMRAWNLLFVLISFHLRQQIQQGRFQFRSVIDGKVTIVVMDNAVGWTLAIGFLDQ